MLTRVDYGFAAGLRNVEADAIELPSQFMENWLYDEDTLRGLSGHEGTGKPAPEELLQKILSARHFRSGSRVLGQMHLAFTDLELHHDYDPEGEETPFEVQARIGERTTILPRLPEDRFLCSFLHVFAGPYAAGYYSYYWAQILSADAFAAFEEAGLEDPEAVARTGRRFRDTVLAEGGGRHPLEVFREFRGREPTAAALMRHSGLA
jgi:oligopeptidase A